MNELYGASETAESPSGPRTAPVRETSRGRETGSYPDAAQGDGSGGYSEADVEAFLAAELRQPESRTRQDAAADTWDDAADDGYGDSDLATEYDGDVEALLAEEDASAEPRTRLEAAAATWDDTTDQGDDDPDAYSGDPASEYDGDVAALLAAEQRQPEPRTRQEVAADTWGDTDGGQDGGADAGTGGTSPSRPDAVAESPAQSSEAEDGTSDPYASETGTPATEISAAPGREDGTGPEHTVPSGADDSSSPEAGQLRAPETENAQAGQENLDPADPEAQDTQRTARAEQPLASTDRHPGDTSTPERGADEPGSQQQQDAVRAGRKDAREGTDAKNAERTSWRHAVVEETVGVGALLVDAYDLTTKIAAHAPGDMLLPAVATVLGTVAVGKAIAKNRKGKDE
jgi:hypothetical protein